MDQRLVATDAALKAGRRDEAIELLKGLLSEQPDQTLQVYRVLLHQLYHAKRYEEGAEWCQRAVERFPREYEITNLWGVMLRQLKRYPEALEVLDRAIKLNPAQMAGHQNRGNVLLDMGDNPRAEQAFSQMARRDPRNAEHHRQLGRALARQGKRDQALVRFRQAIALKKDYVDAWLDMAGIYNELHQAKQAEATLDKAVAANPDSQKLLEAKALVMRRAGQFRRAEAYLQEIAGRFPDAGWVHFQLGNVVSEYDRERGNVFLRRAVELEPDNLDYLVSLIQSIERTRSGDEGANIEEAYQLSKRAVALGQEFTPGHTKVLLEVLTRVCAYDELEPLGDFKTLGRGWAETDRHTALLKQLARVRSMDDRLELVEQHRIWGRIVEDRAKAHPIKKPPRRAPGGKIRLGLMSADLRQHPVAYFALPLFDHVDRERFEVYCYSFYQGDDEDPMQRFITGQVDAFRWWKDISSHDAAQAIANDQLDILIELGGSTHMNKPEVLAYRPAPRQASWLGYPHSLGLSTVDYFVCDPYSAPKRADLLVEEPLMMPHTWLALGRAVFSERHPINEGVPEQRNGFITFGTANNPHKYSREVLQTWARVVASVPNSRFAFIRPEGGTPSFRKNVIAEFAAGGVSEDRIVFHTIRGKHMPFYNEVDITLDPFPLTGGTTTTESLWMGVPLVSMVGEAFHERLSYSILSNAGLGDLCAIDLEQYVATAQKLAADQQRRLQLRHGLRDQIRNSPLGQTEQWARDFYDMVARAVEAKPAQEAKAAGR
ncbi:tetratricopeptide repeat protein [Phenylobacterium sp.]|jgi:predicted O-linked N-acetylglucosamine transferase (SPINDLY family)|uniref:O-linked N-acetylglucosamine transferase, SPINDLY family protein n=1 Tax=Phenylobacterium sp. TaxID=1871053 RepID=UPI002F935F89